ncbi:MAG: sigma-54-dependent transcriptional regulator [Vicinamibacterales bacterium]
MHPEHPTEDPVAARAPVSSGAVVLVVEDRDALRTMLRLALEAHGHVVVEARDQPEAAAVLAAERPDLVVTDLRLPSGDGLGVLRAVKAVDGSVPVVVMTAYGGIQDAVAAMRDGALDFLAKPVDPEHLNLVVERAMAQTRLLREHALLKEELAARRGAPRILGQAPALRDAVQAVQRAAAADVTVLIEGESGTGKELFARALHAWSARAHGPFVAINCAALPETLLESELFGYERGAFTGATQRKLGRFELAHRGTLFLDEIGELAPSIQAKILRVLETREFERVGGTVTLHADVRLVAATNRHLRAEVAARRFREDLFFRLSVVPITVPPLRERGDDVVLLARHVLERAALDRGRRPPALDRSALEALSGYPWPGNVRELQNCLERAALLVDGDTISARHLHLHPIVPPAQVPAAPPPDVDLSGTLDDVLDRARRRAERQAIEAALADNGNDPRRTADALGVGFRDLLGRMRQHGLGTE